MKIALYSGAFAPAVGGLEAMARLLAEEFFAAGHEVVVVTRTAAAGSDGFPFRVVRRPSQAQWAAIVRSVDVTLHMNVSLKAIWPNLLFRRATVVSHQGWYRSGGDGGFRARLKDWTTGLVTNISASRAIARRIAGPSIVIPNSYDERVFRVRNGTARRGIAFVGRLVSDKGADLLLRAVRNLRAAGLAVPLSIIGDGPEGESLRALANELGMADSVHFYGEQSPVRIAELLNHHEILAVPSVWEEPFGIVALEGIACGCVVIGSAGGGLPEAIGECGRTFTRGDVEDLTKELRRVLSDSQLRQSLRREAHDHLNGFSRKAVASGYLTVLGSAIAFRREVHS